MTEVEQAWRNEAYEWEAKARRAKHTSADRDPRGPVHACGVDRSGHLHARRDDLPPPS